MEQEEAQDVHMHDDTVVQSTEPYSSRMAQSASVIPAKTIASSYDGTSSLPRNHLLGANALKGSGKQRELSTTDDQLVRRKDGPKPAKFKNLPRATLQTGLIYDVRMRFHVETDPSEDDLHPEDPRRIHAIFEAFVNAGLAWREGDSGPAGDYYMGRIDTRTVTQDEVCLVHTLDHWNWVQSLSTLNTEELGQEQQHPGHANDSIYLSNSTPYCAALSAGGAIEACRAVILGKVKNVFAVIRPPGHHAEREDAKGFCFYDNVSIATKVCQLEFKEKCRKVLVLDWDVHHGNGIQQANYSDPNVLYISLHVHKRGCFYPEHSYRDNRGPYGDHLHCGEGRGLGKNVNIPWSNQGMGDADYIYAFQQVVMPIATEFDPDLVIIAAGFDAAEGDMLGGCNVTPAGYAHMTHMLMSLAEGRVAVCLEGGYNLESIARSSCAVARTLMGETPDRMDNIIPTASGVDDVKLVHRQQSKFWSSLYPKDLSDRLAGPLQGERMHNVVRGWQAKTLFEEYSMTPLFIHRQHLAKEFEEQVLATPNYAEARPLLVILHDPPEVLASPDPRTGKIELHNTWLTDIVKTYVDGAVTQGFAVIDVNLPKHISDGSDSPQYQNNDSIEFRTKEATQLLTYLWENYIELNENTHIFLLGTNTGHGAIVNFIKSHEGRAQKMLNKAIMFVEDVGLMSCKSLVGNDQLPQWYWTKSLVFVAQDHNYFASDLARKPKKRFGRISQSEANSISDMLLEHREEVFESLLEETEHWKAEKLSSRNDRANAPPSPNKLPPVGNFALSPSKTVNPSLGTSGVTPGNGNRGSPKAPTFASFAPSPRQ